MKERIRRVSSKGLLQSLWYLFKRNAVLILIIVALATGVGATYSYLRKPTYTASVKVCYQVNGEDAMMGEYGDLTAMMAFVDTAIDFVDEGVVLDRASYYYKKWIENKSQYSSLNQFLNECENAYHYDPKLSRVDPRYSFSKNQISVSSNKVANQTQFFYSIRYRDDDPLVAEEKVQILVRAYQIEMKLKDATGQDYVYFDKLETDILIKGKEFVVENITQQNVILIAFCAGVLLAGVVIFIKEKLDNTVRDREELEELIDIKVLAMLDN